MATEPSDPTLESTTRELLAVLREIEEAVEPPRPRGLVRPPTPRGLVEFTVEVAIPAAILVLRTNVAALELLQRTLRMMDDGRERQHDESQVRDRAVDLTRSSLSRLEKTLGDLQRMVDARATDRSPDDLFAEARRRTDELEAQLSSIEAGTPEGEFGRRRAAEVDVDAELASLRRSIDAADANGVDDADGVGDADGDEGTSDADDGDDTPSNSSST